MSLALKSSRDGRTTSTGRPIKNASTMTKIKKLKSIWRDIKRRCEGDPLMVSVTSQKCTNFANATRTCYGKQYIACVDFVGWGLKREDFNRLYDAWAAAGFPKLTITPSIHRDPDNNGNYDRDNMRFVTHTENCAEAGRR